MNGDAQEERNRNNGSGVSALCMRRNLIGEDFTVTGRVLGLGANGKVMECVDKLTGQRFALKVSLTECLPDGQNIR